MLNRLAKHVSEGYEERHQAQTVSQIRDFMRKLKSLQQVGRLFEPARLGTRGGRYDDGGRTSVLLGAS